MSTSEKRTREETSPPRETVSLPDQDVIASNSIPEILEKLKPLMKETSNEYKRPVIIGSRAAAYWLPSFRLCQDWDIVATPNQTYNILESLQDSKKLSISLIRQSLDKNVVRRKPMTPEVEAKLDTLPDCLYKVLGELDTLKFEIEIVPVNQDGSLLETSSAARLLDICNNADDYLDFPIGLKKCVVASLEVLEVLKSSHINWPAYFDKHIADLHTLRAVIPSTSSNVNMGVRADKKKPLTSPERSVELEDFLLTRTLETEAFRGTPGAHINLNVSNEDFLDREDDLFVTRHIPHDDVHLLVKYGDIPIYDQLKTDSSKAMVSRKLFEEAPYDTQLKCVKEEAMVIALERFLLPQLASDPLSAYKSALIRICTTLTKGWFRQFAIDNFPRLALCDKNLLSIRDEILTKHPIPPVKKTDPMVLLKQSITNLEELVIVQKLIPLTRISSFSDIERIVNESKKRKFVSTNDYDAKHTRNSKYAYWIIYSTEDKPLVCISFISTSKFDGEDCQPSYDFMATLAIQAFDRATDISHLESKLSEYKNQEFVYTHHTISAYVHSGTSAGSWGGRDIWGTSRIVAQHLEDGVLKSLDMEGLTEDLFVKYVMAVVQPKLLANGDTPLKTRVNDAKSKGLIPVKPQNHLWYDLWRYWIRVK